jgi:hypothetical protein
VIQLVPINRDDANAYVRRMHRHSRPVQGYKFAVGIEVAGELRGVAIAGRPVARELDAAGTTIEILRVCTDGVRNGCTRLYGACCRAAGALGYQLAITYTLEREHGASLRAAGFRPVARVPDRQWACDARPREQRDLIGDKVRWERPL